MDVLHAVVLSDAVSTKVVSSLLFFLFVSILFFVFVCAKSHYYRLGRASTSGHRNGDGSINKHLQCKPNTGVSQDDDTNYVSEGLHHDKVMQDEFSRIADVISGTVRSMSSSQYVLKDNAVYSSIYQTPVRDNLRVLQNLSNELRHKTLLPTNVSDSDKVKGAQGICSEPVIRDAFVPLKRYAEQSGCVLRLKENAHGFIDMRYGSLDKILRELVFNAIKHNPQGTEIELVCSFTQEQAIFEIKDTGNGISAQTVSRILGGNGASTIYNRRLSDSETHLNLAAISSLANLNKGSLEIKSARNWGTHIRLMLPAADLCKLPVYTKYVKDKRYTINETKHRKKVLFLTKTRVSQCEMMQNLAEQYTLYVCASFNQAMTTMLEDKPDLVIADFVWQQSLAVQFCKFIRSGNLASRVPFVLLTMPLEQSARVSLYAQGISAVLEKPLANYEIELAVKQLLETHALLSNEVQEPFLSYSVGQNSSVKQANPDKCQFKTQLLNLVKDRYKDEDFNGFEAAKALYMSEKTLQRRMHKHFGEPFGQFLKCYKLEQAKEMLLEGMTITEISYELGFTTPSYFGQCFKEEFGYPPSLQQRIQQKNQQKLAEQRMT